MRMQCRTIIAAIMSFVLMSAAQAETYYYVGGDSPSGFSPAGAWATEDGTALTTVADGDTFVFTNETTVTFSNQFKPLQANDPKAVNIVKRGNGTVKVSDQIILTDPSSLTLEEGVFRHENKRMLLRESFALNVARSAAKSLYLVGPGAHADGNFHCAFTIATYSETEESTGTMTFFFYGNNSTETRNVTLKGAEGSTTRFSAVMDYDAAFDALAVFDWNPGYSSSVMEVVGRDYNKAKGAFKVSSGVLRFGEGAGVTSLSSITVAAGATLEVSNGIASDTFGCGLVVEDGGHVEIEDEEGVRAIVFNSLVTNGVAVVNGRYKASDLDFLSGECILVVGTGELPVEPETTVASWTAGGGADTSVKTSANWGGTLPDLSSGSLVATFPVGAEATIPAGETVTFKGIVIQKPFRISSGGDGSVMKLGSEGVKVTAAGSTFTNAVATAITRSQVWENAGGATNFLAAAGVVSCDWATLETLTMTGGCFVVNSSNPGLCNVDYYADIHAYADVPLGGKHVTANAREANKVVYCHGVTFSNNFAVAISNWQNSKYNLFTIVDGRNFFCGKVTSSHPNGHYWRFADNNTQQNIDESTSVTFKGGYATSYSPGNEYSQFSSYHNGTINIEDTPMDVARMYVGWPTFYKQVLNLNVSSNATTRGIHLLRNAELNTAAPYALYATDNGQSGVLLNDNAKWTLSGDQGVNVFAGITNTATVTSSAGSTLHLRDDRLNTVYPNENSTVSQSTDTRTFVCDVSLSGTKVQTNKVVFAGDVCFSKEGVLDHYMEGASTSTGSVSVKGGKLVFTTGSWRNASSVNVSNGGKIEIQNAAAFMRTVPFAFTGESTDGMCVIPSGVTLRIDTVTVNGRQLNGTVTSGLVAGGGTLVAGRVGFAIIVR